MLLIEEDNCKDRPRVVYCYCSLLLIEEDNCKDSPCDHGSCADGDGDYTCNCDEGWSGKNCDTGNGSKKFCGLVNVCVNFEYILPMQKD